MNVADPELERLVCQELRDAGFAVAPSRKPSDGGLSVWCDPERGVVVRWSVPSGDPSRHDTIRTAVRLALRTILGAAGFEVAEVAGRAELVVTAAGRPPRQDGAKPGLTTP
ncbi:MULTISPECIES: hypothetical protein [Nonomuraea]|jgi:hypothetical protein|uniref:Uncharacterized protein n=1 Tax=Nonomuraea harbinensis TaxID=1286938 RepID=A0ABW1BQN5_9ACTN|nr:MULTISPECIES: hypothetical protein [Nonomuraea]TXK41302.1 hypothetical protein FR742_18555 [Nonomuraea sp. C10]